MAYNPILGRWIQQDPSGYVDGMSLYEAERTDPVAVVDPAGTAATRPSDGEQYIKDEKLKLSIGDGVPNTEGHDRNCAGVVFQAPGRWEPAQPPKFKFKFDTPENFAETLRKPK